MDKVQNQIQECEICYKIKCRGCGWEPDEAELAKVISREISVCPDCGRAP